MRNFLMRLVKEEDAATAVEYAIIAAVVGVALITSLVFFREQIAAMFMKAGSTISHQ